MFCDKCGAEVLDNDVFCGSCGATIGGNQSKEPVLNNGQTNPAMMPVYQTPPPQNTTGMMNSSQYSSVFVEPDEQLLGTLGNGYLESMLSVGKVKKCRALLTNKRVYFQGTFFTGSGKSLIQEKREQIIDLEDITGTGFIYSKPFGILFAILSMGIPFLASFIFIVLGSTNGTGFYKYACAFGGIDVIAIILNIILYIKSRKTKFAIEYAGGSIRFYAHMLGISNVKDFQKQIRRAKDHVKETR